MQTLAVTFPGGWELIAILFIFVLLFGAKKLPELGSSIGASIKNFKRGVNDAEAEDEDEASASDPRSPEAEVTDEASPAAHDKP